MNDGLRNAEWLVLVQTPAAIASPFVQAEVNTALMRVMNRVMQGVLPLVAAPCPPQSIPPIWQGLRHYDATQDYPAALEGVLQVLGIDKAPPVISPSTSGATWTPVDLMYLWSTISPGARRALGEIVRRPDGYPFAEVLRRLDCTGPTLGGYLSSLGFALRQFPGKKDPLERDWNKEEYRMDAAIAGILQRLAQITAGQ